MYQNRLLYRSTNDLRILHRLAILVHPSRNGHFPTIIHDRSLHF